MALRVEESWRMVEGEHDSFDTSVVPNEDNDEDNPFLSSGQPSQTSTSGGGGGGGGSSGGVGALAVGAGGGSFSSGEDSRVGSQEGGSSQDADLDAFLRKAEDERVLLRSPFQPSVPSSVRESPMSSASYRNNNSNIYRTPEPEFRMPKVDVESSTRLDGHVRQRPGFRVSEAGSPVQRIRRTSSLLSQSEPAPEPSSSSSSPHSPRRRAFLAALGVLLTACALALAGLTQTSSCATALLLACRLPGVAWLDLAACSPGGAERAAPPPSLQEADGMNATAAHHHYHDTRTASEADDNQDSDRSLSHRAAELMRAQTRLAAVVRDRVVPPGPLAPQYEAAAPPAQDAWLVPRMQTKGLRLHLQMQSAAAASASASASAAVAAALLLELGTYLDAAKRVSMALTQLQTGGGATAADTLAHRTRRTLAQVRRAAREGESGRRGGKPSSGWLPWMRSSSAEAARQSRRRLLRDAYRRHVDALVAKTGERAAEAAAVLAALDAAGAHLDAVQGAVVAQRDVLGGRQPGAKAKDPEDVPLSVDVCSGGLSCWWRWWRWPRWPSSSSATAATLLRQWDGFATQLATVRVQHDDVVQRTAAAQTDLAAVQKQLVQLQRQFGDDDNDEDEDVSLHMDILEAGLQDLAWL